MVPWLLKNLISSDLATLVTKEMRREDQNAGLKTEEIFDPILD